MASTTTNAGSSTESWKTKLNRMGFLREWNKDVPKKVYTLRPPLKLRFSKKAIEQIRENYPKFEVGGLMLAKPTLEGGDKNLEVGEVILLKNLSATPERSFHFKKGEIFRVWKEKSEVDNECYVPIHFHSHPQIDLESVSNIYSMIASLSPVTTSGKDQETSLGLDINIDGLDFLIPCALVVESHIVGEDIIIGFYGGGITPTGFTEYMASGY